MNKRWVISLLALCVFMIGWKELEIVLMFQSLGWQTDILWIWKVPYWVALEFWRDVMLLCMLTSLLMHVKESKNHEKSRIHTTKRKTS